MDLGRRRLWLALASASAFLVHRLIVELALGQGHVSRGALDGQPFARVVIAVVSLAIVVLIARDLRRGRQDWPVERLVALLATLGAVAESARAASLGLPLSPTLLLLDTLARWVSVLAGLAIWLRGRKP